MRSCTLAFAELILDVNSLLAALEEAESTVVKLGVENLRDESVHELQSLLNVLWLSTWRQFYTHARVVLAPSRPDV